MREISCYTDDHKRLFVMQTLAYAKYDVLIKNDHDNFIRFIYDCIKEEAADIQHYAHYEEHEDLSFTECMHRVFEGIQEAWLNDPDITSVKDFICLARPDAYHPIFVAPLIYSYDSADYQ